MSFELQRLLRPNISTLVPYSSARSECDKPAEVFLDANENNFGSAAGEGLNRYPDPLQNKLRREISKVFEIDENEIFIGNGSDEAIDLLLRIFCRPGKDEVITCPPTYGMYETAAAINDVGVRPVPLKSGFSLDRDGILRAIKPTTRVIFICSPNNPTGNLMSRTDILAICRDLRCIVAVDEAYIDFADEESLLSEIRRFPNLVVFRTLSKAFGCAGLRLGMAFANRQIISLFNAVKPPYNVGTPTAGLAIDALRRRSEVYKWTRLIRRERDWISGVLANCRIVEAVYPSDANFLLVRFSDARKVYEFLLQKGIVVRDRSRLQRCENCLRISVGTPDENQRLIEAIKEIECI